MILCPHIDDVCKDSNFAVFFLDIFLAFSIISILFIILVLKPIIFNGNIINDSVSSLIKVNFENHALKLLGLGYLSLLLFIILSTSIYNNTKDRIPLTYDTYKFILILTILIISIESIIYYLMFNSHQSNVLINIIKNLTFNQIGILILIDLIFIISVFLLAVMIHKHKLNSKWYVLTLTLLSLIYLFNM